MIRNMVVNLAINHTFDADLDITLRHVPSGTAVNLLHDVGDSSDGFMLTLINGLPTNIQTATAAAGETIHGSFAPAEALTPFFGLDASGEWVLDITDDTATNTGRFFGWSLTFVY